MPVLRLWCDVEQLKKVKELPGVWRVRPATIRLPSGETDRVYLVFGDQEGLLAEIDAVLGNSKGG